MTPPLYCITAWFNDEAGNILLEMNRELTVADRMTIRNRLTEILRRDGIGFKLQSDINRVVLEPTPHTRAAATVEVDKFYAWDLTEELGFGTDFIRRTKYSPRDTLLPGIRKVFVPLPPGYFARA